MGDLKNLLEQLRLHYPEDRKRIGLFMSEKIYLEFQKLCDGVSVSAVVEAWMKQQIEENKPKKK